MRASVHDATVLDPWFLEHLVCPRTKGELRLEGDRLVSSAGDEYGIVDGVPVMLRRDIPPTHWSGKYALWKAGQLPCPEHGDSLAREGERAICPRGHGYELRDDVPAELIPDFYTVNWARTVAEMSKAPPQELGPRDVDPVVQTVISATGGLLWSKSIGSLRSYPIPDLRLPEGDGKLLLDIGCNWGRWCIAAARRGYQPVGVDPSLIGIEAAIRVARQLGVPARFVVADSRFLPFRERSIDVAFSYSVLQNVAKQYVRWTALEVGRVLKHGGLSMIQMAAAYGAWQLVKRWRLRHRKVEPDDFVIRWWTVRELESSFGEWIGPSEVEIDGFFSLNSQPSEAHLMPWHYRQVVHASEALRTIARVVPGMRHVADSVYIVSRKP